MRASLPLGTRDSGLSRIRKLRYAVGRSTNSRSNGQLCTSCMYTSYRCGATSYLQVLEMSIFYGPKVADMYTHTPDCNMNLVHV